VAPGTGGHGKAPPSGVVCGIMRGQRAGRADWTPGRCRAGEGVAWRRCLTGLAVPADAPAPLTTDQGWKRPLKSYAHRGPTSAQVRTLFFKKVWRRQTPASGGRVPAAAGMPAPAPAVTSGQAQVNHAGRQYNSSHARHARPDRQLLHTIQSPKRANTTSSTKIRMRR
jgi:hypothetical protein